MNRVFTLFLFLFSVAAGVDAQCPKVSVSGPDSVQPEQPATFTVSVTGGDRNLTPTFNWTVSAGTISSGQGTSTITVDTTYERSSIITATVDVGGYERRCPTTDSSTTSIISRPTARKIDEYGTMMPNDRNDRIDNFAIVLQEDPTAQGYIIAYGGRRTATGAAAATLKATRGYLIYTRGISSDRIVTINGGYREAPKTELWAVPQGAAPPQAEPTVDPSEIKYPAKKKPAPKRPAKRRS
jgi:hypothetical protein